MRIAVGTCIIVSMLAAFWFASDTTWNLFLPDFLGYYENHGAHLLQGRLDVDYSAILWESLQKNGENYGYFGPVPALARILLTAVSPAHAYHWTALSILSGILSTILLSWFLIASTLKSLFTLSRKERLFIEVVLLTNVGLGSTLLTLSSPSFIYHEAIVWGNAMVLAAALALIRYLDGFQLRYALLAVGLSALAINTRTSVGLGAAIMLILAFGALLLLFRCPTRASYPQYSTWIGMNEVPRLIRRHLFLVVVVIIVASTPFALTWAKFGELSLMPYHYNIALSPERLKRVNGTLFQPGNFFFNFKNYFNPSGISVAKVFPYINLAPKEWKWRQDPGIHFDRGEPFMPVTLSMALWILLAVAGVYGVFRGLPTLRRRVAPIIGTMMGGAVILAWAGISNRYTHDLFPFLLITGTAGIVWLDKLSAPKRAVLYAAAVLLTILAIHLNFAVCLLNVFAGPGLNEKLLMARTRLDGTWVSVPVVDTTDSNAQRGIVLVKQDNVWGVVLSNKIPLGLTVGARVDFAASGARTVTDIASMEENFMLLVDGPLDPNRDGAPAAVNYRRLPCTTLGCGATGFDE